MPCLFGHKWDGCICTKCGKTRHEGHRFEPIPKQPGYEKCQRCGLTRAVAGAPTQTPQRPAHTQPQPTTPNYAALVRELSCLTNLTMDESREEALERQLLAGGQAAASAIETFLLSCAAGAGPHAWWSQARRLVKLLGRFPGVDAQASLSTLLAAPSNLWEYETQVRETAKAELARISPPPPTQTPPEAPATETAPASPYSDEVRQMLDSSLFIGARKSLLGQVTDQETLAIIALQGDFQIANPALDRLTDPAILDRVEKEAQHPDIRRYAPIRKEAVRLAGETDPNKLYQTAMHASGYFVQMEAVQKLADKALLAAIIQNHPDWRIRETAQSRLQTL